MSDVMNMTVTMGQVATAVELIFAVLLCFFGYRMMKQLMALCGFLLGFILGSGFVGQMSGLPSYAPAVAGVILGIILAVLSYRLYKLGVFLYAGSAAASVVYSLPYYPAGDTGHYIAIACAAVAFLLVGWLAVKASRSVLILITGICGAWLAISCLSSLWPALAGFGLPLLVYRLVLAALGLAYQFITGK